MAKSHLKTVECRFNREITKTLDRLGPVNREFDGWANYRIYTIMMLRVRVMTARFGEGAIV